MSAAFMAKAVVRAQEPTRTEYVTVPVRPGIGDETNLKLSLAISKWNQLWEAAQFRRRFFDDDELPPPLYKIADSVDVNVIFVPRTGSRYHEYAPLFHLLPQAALRRHSLPLEQVSQTQATDNLLGGAVKLSKPNWLDAAGWAAAHADRCTAVLHAELADVGLARPLGNAWAVVAPIGMAGGLFEQMFRSNMVARDRINHARRSVGHSAQLVAGVRAEVAERTRLVESHRAAVPAEREALLRN